MHIACGDIFDVDVVNNEFIIRSTEQYLLDIILDKENMETLKNAFKQIGKEYTIKVEKQTKQTELIESDINYLKENYGKYLKIKE